MATDPQLRAVFDKLKQTDVVLAEAFHDVPVPQGLADRILDRLASADETSVSPEEPIVAQDNAVELDSSVAKRGRFWRRRRFLVTASLATAGTLAAILMWRAPEEGLTAESVERAAVMLFDAEGDLPLEGSLISEEAPPESHPLGDQVVRIPGIRWRLIDEFLDWRGVAYDLAPPGNPRATLYVIKCKVPELPTLPLDTPAFNSRGRCAAAWQSGGLLFVLVVDGGERRYRGFLVLSRGRWT